MTKPCRKCGQVARYANGDCRRCSAISSKAYYTNHREERLAYTRSLPASHKRTLQRKSHLKRVYGLSIEEFEAILVGQGGRCQICKTPMTGIHGWHVDHCHTSGKIRGILCKKCNPMLGYANDDAAILQSAVEYLTGVTPGADTVSGMLSFGS